MKEIAILGATASGKSALAIEIAKEVNANILSLDSLSIYKEIDIVSAKPSMEERAGILHFGIDVLTLDQYFSAATFFKLYKEAKQASIAQDKNLIIVGGTSFYLKSMLEGLSPKVSPSAETDKKIEDRLQNLEDAYIFLSQKDKSYADKISSHDSYRIQKWYEIYFESGLSATNFFTQNPKFPLISNIDIFDIEIDRDILKDRISQRTSIMIENGLIEEVFYLEKKYSRLPRPMQAIGITETLDYLDGKIDLRTLHELISTHTLQLAKRQETFNKSQFTNRTKDIKVNLKNILLSLF